MFGFLRLCRRHREGYRHHIQHLFGNLRILGIPADVLGTADVEGVRAGDFDVGQADQTSVTLHCYCTFANTVGHVCLDNYILADVIIAVRAVVHSHPGIADVNGSPHPFGRFQAKINMIFRAIPVQQLERNLTAFLQVKLILRADLAVCANIGDVVIRIRQGDEFAVLRGNRLIIRYDLIPDVHDHNIGLAVSGIRFFCRLIGCTRRFRINVLHAQRIIHPDAVQIEIRAFFVQCVFIKKNHPHTVCTIRQIRIAVNGDVVQGIQLAYAIHHNGINVPIGRLTALFAIYQLRDLHLNITGSRADPAIDRGAGAGKVIGELRCCVQAKVFRCTCVHHRAVAVLPIVQIGFIRAVGAVRIITHIAGLLIDIAGSSLRLPLHCAIGILHPRISAISEVLLIIHGGSGDDGDRGRGRSRSVFRSIEYLALVVSNTCGIGQLFNAVQRLGQRIGDGSIIVTFSFAVLCARNARELDLATVVYIVSQRINPDRQAVINNDPIVRRNNGNVRLLFQEVGAGKRNGIRSVRRACGSDRHTGIGSAAFRLTCPGDIRGAAELRNRVCVCPLLLHMVAAVLADLHIELCGLVVFQRKRTAAGGGSSSDRHIVLVIDVIGLIGYRGRAVEQGKREVSIVDRSLLGSRQRCQLAVIILGLGDLLGNGNRVLLGQVELDAAVGAALTTIHVINGQGVIAL